MWLLCIQPMQSVESLAAATPPPNRRDVLMGGMAAAMVVVPSIANAAEAETVDMAAIAAARKRVVSDAGESIDMNKINAARATTTTTTAPSKMTRSIVPILDPPPRLSIRGGIGGKSAMTIKVPRVGYSFYKTPVDQAERCTSLALRAGIRHLDVATSYQSNPRIAKALKQYLDVGLTALDFGDEKPEVLERLDATSLAGELHVKTTRGGGGGASSSSLSPAPLGSAGRRGRREGLFLSHKISNDEQQAQDATSVRRSVKAAIATLGCSYLDLVSIHSPLTDKARRLTSYQALLDLRDSGFCKSVGVCNYGVGALQEICVAGLELPAVNQLELSPFNAHKDVVEWCDTNGIAIACSAWSKLSGARGPTEGWDVLSKLAQEKGMTKAQVLVRWALQKGYLCVPRSASASKVERLAIAENSYGGVNNPNNEGSFILSSSEMRVLDALDIGYKAGKLGRIDGWTDTDITGPEWDPTDFV
jgi:diketogulonate reductase-like aldo/keto reductase